MDYKSSQLEKKGNSLGQNESMTTLKRLWKKSIHGHETRRPAQLKVI